ncbi:MAG: hypothetical protein M3O46_16800, partial [Myxococcota bacterium]|nr:hypothetical protein [Myxococcota bacterium]
MPTTEFDRVLADPSRDDVERARDQLLEVVVDFPFAKEEHRSAWLAFLLTLIARPAIAGCIPLIDTDATTAGTGKGKLIDAASIIATGREATKTPLPSDDDEFRKRITSLVSEGEGLAVLDNVTSTVNSAALDAALTATMWKDRVLGRSATVTAPNLLVWAVTGNNVQLGADTARRTLHIRLESRVESPENRSDFRHPDLLAWVRDNRPRLVTAALTILRGYFADGAKDMGVKPWGSFEGWSRTIANCVVWAGLPDPQATRLELASMADATNNSLSALIEGWSRLAPEGGLSAKSAIAVLYTADHMRGTSPPDGHDDLRETIETIIATSQGKQPSAARLGYTLRRFRRRIVGGRMLDCQTDRKGVAKWAVIGADDGESRTYALPSAGDAGDEGDVSSPSRRRMAETNTGVGGRNIPGNAQHPRQGSLVDVEREAIQAEAIGTLPERQYSSLSPNERMAFDNGVRFTNMRIVGAPQRARAR